MFRRLHAEAADASAPPQQGSAVVSVDDPAAAKTYVIPHLPGEGRFTVGAKVSTGRTQHPASVRDLHELTLLLPFR
jgi:hypothetical protein